MDVKPQVINGVYPEPDKLVMEIERLHAIMLEQEKLASIGQLTAGILHEIRNPLNFIINFSKISLSLVDDMKEILDKVSGVIDHDNLDELTDIETNLSRNLDKISENGERAMRIMVNMLAQSKDNNAVVFEPTDLNQLVDDHLKLAYQGVRGNNSDFNLTMKTGFDKGIGKVNIDAHDLGRAILNIVNNACYAMEDKRKQQLPGTYNPLIEVNTLKTLNGFSVSIKDNGTGIPAAIKEKIFKPFFTTKPDNEGTGLGLSMTYDIISKIHKGTLEVNSVDGESTEFIISIPVTAAN
jgi:two-component system NtrC family sensor kinase